MANINKLIQAYKRMAAALKLRSECLKAYENIRIYNHAILWIHCVIIVMGNKDKDKVESNPGFSK